MTFKRLVALAYTWAEGTIWRWISTNRLSAWAWDNAYDPMSDEDLAAQRLLQDASDLEQAAEVLKRHEFINFPLRTVQTSPSSSYTQLLSSSQVSEALTRLANQIAPE